MATNPELLKRWLELYSDDDERLKAVSTTNQYDDETILDKALTNPDSLSILLNIWPEHRRLDAIKLINGYGNSILHEAVDRPVSFETILKHLPENQRLDAVKITNEDGDTILHNAIKKPDSLEILLNLLPDEEDLSELMNIYNHKGESILTRAKKAHILGDINIELLNKLKQKLSPPTSTVSEFGFFNNEAQTEVKQKASQRALSF